MMSSVTQRCTWIVSTFSLILFVLMTEVLNDDVVPSSEGHAKDDIPTVFVSVMITGKDDHHILPYSLHYLQRIDYPKERMIICICTPRDLSESVTILAAWAERVKYLYQRVELKEQYGSKDGTHQLSRWRQEALDASRSTDVDYLWMLDATVIHTNRSTLKSLIHQNKTIIAPKLNVTTNLEKTNFCCTYPGKIYNKDATTGGNIASHILGDDNPIINVTSSVLINLRHRQTRDLSYLHNSKPYDVNAFAQSVRKSSIKLHVLTDALYGFMTLTSPKESDISTPQQLEHILLENIVYHTPLKHLPYIQLSQRKPDKLGFDQIYVVNLKRRSSRRQKMVESFKLLGIQAKFMEGVDGEDLNKTFIEENGIKILSTYTSHRYDKSNRPFSLGEVGCFLSHYHIWQNIIAHDYKKVLIFEDDVRFKPNFRHRLSEAMADIQRLHIDWDLIYIGRNSTNAPLESGVPGSDNLVYPENSHWTLGYILSGRAARKLVEQEPLKKMVPADHYLPIMFDKYHYDYNRLQYTGRDLKALSVHPLLIEPSHQKQHSGYISDTVWSASLHDIVGDDTCTVDNVPQEPHDDR